MDVELNNKIHELQVLKDKLARKIASVQKKLDRIAKKPKTAKTEAELKKVNYLLDTLQNQFKELEEKLQRIEEARKTVRQYEREKDLARGTSDEQTKKEEYEKANELYKDLIDRTYNEYTGKNGIAVNKGFNLTKTQIIGSVVAGVSVVALIVALKTVPSMINNSNKTQDGTNGSSSQDKTQNGDNNSNENDKPTEVNIPELEKDELSALIKVENETDIPSVAKGLLTYLKAVDPETDITLEEITAYLNYKNGFDKTNTQEPTQESVETPTTGTFTDINDEEQLLERVNGIIVPVYDHFAPQYGVDETYGVDMFNHINGGATENPSRESCLDVIRTAEVLMNSEYLYAADMKNKGESLREESTSTIDYGIFFLDGSKAQVIASRISDYRRRIITAPTSEDANKASIEFTEFLMNSWYLQGNNGEISLYAIKNSGQAALLDKLFLNTADLAQANQKEDHQVTVINPLTGEEITLREIIEEINAANCLVEKEADNGERFMQYVNKFSADMDGMYKEAVSANIQKSEEFTYGLNYNKK